MSEQPKNVSASIHARLANEARRLGRPFNEILQYYGMERFLYRLFKTKYADSFILKGGLIFYGWGISLRRPTRDIDLLGLIKNQKAIIARVISSAFSISVPEDGVSFDPETLVVEVTQVDADRRGMRATFRAYLGRARIPMQIDFGFSDEITSEAVITNYPTLLEEMAGPQIRSYPVESVIAEKFHAMQHYADVPSRWKDYYDLWLISTSFELDDQALQKAIAKTFENRETSLPGERPVSLTADFAEKYQSNWTTFLKKSGLENDEIDDLLALVEKIWIFLAWPLQGLALSHSRREHRQWMPGPRKWK